MDSLAEHGIGDACCNICVEGGGDGVKGPERSRDEHIRSRLELTNIREMMMV